MPMTRWAAVALVLLTCRPESGVCRVTPLLLPEQPISFAEPGALHTVKATQAVTFVCDTGVQPVISANVEVLSPDNLPVTVNGSPATARLKLRDFAAGGGDGSFLPPPTGGGAVQYDAEAQFGFVPEAPGPYHVTISWEPGVARVQQTIHVIRPLNEVAQFEGTVNGCVEVVQLGDVVVCQQSEGHLVELFDGGVRHERVSSGIALGTSRLWSWAPNGEVSAFQADAGQLQLIRKRNVSEEILTAAEEPQTHTLTALTSSKILQVAIESGGTDSVVHPMSSPSGVSRQPAVSPRRGFLVFFDTTTAEQGPALCVADEVEPMAWCDSFDGLRKDGIRFWGRVGDELLTQSTAGLGQLDSTFDSPEFVGAPAPGLESVLRLGTIPFSLKGGRAVVYRPLLGEFVQLPMSRAATMNEQFVWEHVGTSLKLFKR